LAQQDRLQPSLLDRLTDDEPSEKQESRDKRVMSLRKLREAVIRDLAWLLNTSDFTSAADLTDYPLVAASVLNYGMPAMAGYTVSSVNLPVIERLLKQSIINFEPRILAKSLKVKIVVAENEMNHNAMNFDIEGELWAQPVPLRLLLKTEIDLETGAVTVVERGGQGGG
jgi:type VI secretion system protein ImpF